MVEIEDREDEVDFVVEEGESVGVMVEVEEDQAEIDNISPAFLMSQK